MTIVECLKSVEYTRPVHAAMRGVSELPFLDLGDESRVPGEGRFFGLDDANVQLNESLGEISNSLPFPFGNGTETSIYVSLCVVKIYLFQLALCIMNRFHKTLGVSCTLQSQLFSLGIKNLLQATCIRFAVLQKEPECSYYMLTRRQ